MANRNVLGTFRQLMSELRVINSEGRVMDSLWGKFVVSQYRKYQTTEKQLCKHQQEMQFLAETYVCYLRSVRKYKDIQAMYHAKGERSVKETADIVGFKLPQDPK